MSTQETKGVIESIGLCGFELLLIALFEALPQALKFYSLVNLLGK